MSDVTFLVGLIGSTVRRTWLANMRMVRTDDNGYLEVVAPAGAMVNVNLDAIEGNNVPQGGVNGMLPVMGDVVDGGPVTASWPVKLGAVSDEVLSAVLDARVVHLVTDLYRRLRTLPEGPIPDGTAATSFNPLKLGAVVDQVLSVLLDGQMAHLVVDTYRRLYVRSAAYDDVAAADRVSSNTIADDRDESAQVWAAETNTDAGTSYYPSSAGYEVGNRDHLTFTIVNTDCTLTVQVSNDATTWVDITPSVMDLTSGTTLAVSFPTGVGLSANWILDMERVNARYVRCAVVYPDAGNATSIKVMARKA